RKIRSGGILDGDGLGKSTGGQNIVVIELQGTGDHRIEARDLRSAPQSADDQAGCASARSRRSAHAGATGAGPDGPAQPARVASGRTLQQAQAHAQRVRARIGAEYVRIRDVKVVTGNSDVQIVLEREGHGVVHGEIQLAIPQEL